MSKNWFKNKFADNWIVWSGWDMKKRKKIRFLAWCDTTSDAFVGVDQKGGKRVYNSLFMTFGKNKRFRWEIIK